MAFRLRYEFRVLGVGCWVLGMLTDYVFEILGVIILLYEVRCKFTSLSDDVHVYFREIPFLQTLSGMAAFIRRNPLSRAVIAE